MWRSAVSSLTQRTFSKFGPGQRLVMDPTAASLSLKQVQIVRIYMLYVQYYPTIIILCSVYSVYSFLSAKTNNKIQNLDSMYIYKKKFKVQLWPGCYAWHLSLTEATHRFSWELTCRLLLPSYFNKVSCLGISYVQACLFLFAFICNLIVFYCSNASRNTFCQQRLGAVHTEFSAPFTVSVGIP